MQRQNANAASVRWGFRQKESRFTVYYHPQHQHRYAVGRQHAYSARNGRKLATSGIKNGALSVRFADIAADWNAGSADAPGLRAALNLYAFRREDGGGVDIDRLSHAVHLLTVWLELLSEKYRQYRHQLA